MPFSNLAVDPGRGLLGERDTSQFGCGSQRKSWGYEDSSLCFPSPSVPRCRFGHHFVSHGHSCFPREVSYSGLPEE